MPLEPAQCLALLTHQPAAQAVYTELVDGVETIVVVRQPGTNPDELNLPDTLYGRPVEIRTAPEFRPLILPITDIIHEPPCPQGPQHRSCHDEPIPGGTQIMPQGAGWVGTLGSACKFTDDRNNTRWGILSNWHVMVTDHPRDNHPQHQPTDAYPAIAHLTDYDPVSRDAPNLFDAAVADARIGDYHSVGRQLLGAGLVGPDIALPQTDLEVAKSGRTTGLTKGRILSIDAAVKVNYGLFTASFLAQLLIRSDTSEFSAPGDSGSLVVTQGDLCPIGLLFAGGGGLTIASPLSPIAQRFGLSFRL